MAEKKANNNVLYELSNLVNTPSYGKISKTHPIMEYLRSAFKDCVEIVELTDQNENNHLLIGVNHELKDIKDCILLSGHIDTVKETEGHNSYITFENDKLKGLGTSDMKSFIATLIANIDYIKSLDIPVVISITSDEETKLYGIEYITSELKKRNINASMIIVGEPTNLDYYVSSRGNSIYVSIMNGIACHSGTPELGINAIELQTAFINEILKLKAKFKEESAVCITHINGGETPSNVVPAFCSTCFGIRTSNSKVLKAMYSYLQDKHKEISHNYGESKLFNVLTIPPFERRPSEFIIREAEANNKELIDAQYATEAGYFEQLYPDSSIVIYGPGDPNCIHKAGEGIEPNKLLTYESEFKEMLQRYIEYQHKQTNGMGMKLIPKDKK